MPSVLERLMLAQSGTAAELRFARLESMDQWWHWLVLVLAVLATASYVVLWYRRDWIELPKALGWTLLLLRLAAMAGLLLFFMDLQKRSEQRITRNSRLAILVDTSLSMSLPLHAPSESNNLASRIASVHQMMKEHPWLEQLQQRHDTTIYRFDQKTKPTSVASFAKPSPADGEDPSERKARLQSLWYSTSRLAWLGTIAMAAGWLGLLLGLGSRIAGLRGDGTAYLVLAGTVLGLVALTMMSTAILRAAPLPWKSLWASQMPEYVDRPRPAESGSDLMSTGADTPSPRASHQRPSDLAWPELLAATGSETRIGDAIASIIEQERGSPLAAIVVITDGENNAGVEPKLAIADAALGNIRLYAIGLGSTQSPTNVRLVDVEAPKRVYPGDGFRVSALLQSTGYEGTTMSVQLRRSPADGSPNFTIEEEKSVVLEADDLLQPVQFEVQPQAIGPWIYDVKVLAPAQDANAQDNSLDTQVRVVEPRSQVLVLAGGPTREYQFVRNLLYRDKTVQSHVLLQSGGPGISQESRKLLAEFPKTLAEMAEYDCVMAFDADFMSLTVEQVEVLEKWVSQQGGGLILVAGPVSTPRWAGTEGNGDRRAELLRAMAPVVLNARGTRLVSLGNFEGETAWPLKISEDGLRSDILRLVNAPGANKPVWERFGGVYSHYACYDAKPGAMPLAYFSDPNTVVDGKAPIYLASHFFGAGRVAFQASGEMWRLREQSDAFFDAYFIKLLRWAAQGRLLRDSDRGMLLLDQEQALVGEKVAIRAVLRDNQFLPLLQARADAVLIDPQKRRSPLVLFPSQDPSQPGVYLGQFLVDQTGTYTVELALGGLADQEILSQQVAVRVPAREIQRPQRNDLLLNEMTKKTAGRYYIGWTEALGGGSRGTAALVEAIDPQDQVHFLRGAPDIDFQERLMALLLCWIAGVLSLEWLIRRLNKLA